MNKCITSASKVAAHTLKTHAETGYSNISQARFYLEDEGMVSVLVTSRAQGCGGQFACRRVKRVVDVLGRLQDTLG